MESELTAFVLCWFSLALGKTSKMLPSLKYILPHKFFLESQTHAIPGFGFKMLPIFLE